MNTDAMSSQTPCVGTRIQNIPEISFMGYRSPRKSLQPNHSHQECRSRSLNSPREFRHLTPWTQNTNKTKQNKNCSRNLYLDNRSEQIHKLHGNQMAKTTPTRHKPDPFSNRPLISHRYHHPYRNHQKCENTLSDTGVLWHGTYTKRTQMPRHPSDSSYPQTVKRPHFLDLTKIIPAHCTTTKHPKETQKPPSWGTRYRTTSKTSHCGTHPM